MAPNAKRDESVWRYLEPSVRIKAPGCWGSGTICYYDESTNTAYVISCGHLFSGTRNPDGDGVGTCHIDVFYKNGKVSKVPSNYNWLQ